MLHSEFKTSLGYLARLKSQKDTYQHQTFSVGPTSMDITMKVKYPERQVFQNDNSICTGTWADPGVALKGILAVLMNYLCDVRTAY